MNNSILTLWMLMSLSMAPASSTSVPLCQFTVESFVSSLSTDQSIDQQISELLPVCEEISDEEERRHCQRNIQSYWSYLAPVLYSDNLNTEAVYERICGSDLGPDACETCKLRVEELAVIMTEEEMVVNMTSQVQGELFCDMEGAWWDVEGCKVELVRKYCD